MELSDLARLFAQAHRETGHTEFVVVGSLSVVGVLDRGGLPERMLVSIDVDCYTPRDPDRIFDLGATLGQGSAFEAEHGYYLDPISPNLPTLPENWRHRLVQVPLEGGITLLFLDPNDAAVSRYSRAEPRDREWIRAGLQAGVLHGGIIASRFRETRFLDQGERARAWAALEEDRAEPEEGQEQEQAEPGG